MTSRVFILGVSAALALSPTLSTRALAQAQAPAAAPEAPAPSPDAEALSPEEAAELEAAFGQATPSAPSAPAPQTRTARLSADASANPALTFLPAFSYTFADAGEPSFGGAHDPVEPGFTVRQLELSAGGAVDPFFRVDGTLVFEDGGIEIEEFFATSLALPLGLQARVGRMLTRFGRHNQVHPHQWLFQTRPMAFTALAGAEGDIGVGAELSWLAPLPWSVEVIGGVFTPEGATFMDEGPWEGDQLKAMGAIKQFFPLSDDLSLLVGVSGAAGPSPDGPQALVGGDLFLKWQAIRENPDLKALTLQLEWISDGALARQGGYLEVAARYSRQWSVAARGDWLQPGAGEALETRASLALLHHPTEFSRVRAELITDAPLADGSIPVVGVLTLELALGAHAAHAY